MNALSKDASVDLNQLSLPGFLVPEMDPDSAREYARYQHLRTGWWQTIEDIKRFVAAFADGVQFILDRNAERRIAQEVSRLSAYQRADIGIAPTSAEIFANDPRDRIGSGYTL